MRYAVGMPPGGHDQTDGAVKERVEEQIKEPALYNVVLLNDEEVTSFLRECAGKPLRAAA